MKLPEALGGAIQTMRERVTEEFSATLEAGQALAKRNNLSMLDLRDSSPGNKGPEDVDATFLRLLHRCLDYAQELTFQLAKGPPIWPDETNDQGYIQEWRSAGAAAPAGVLEQLGHRQACLYDRAIRHIAHAGYIEAHIKQTPTTNTHHGPI